MPAKITAVRYHDISCGHRVVGHENKCVGLHGHNYRITFTCSAPQTDALGRIIDFSIIKSELCMWLEMVWDHKMLLWEKDPLLELLRITQIEASIECELVSLVGRAAEKAQQLSLGLSSVVSVPFNPTAENMALYLLETVGPSRLGNSDVKLIHVKVEETRKCSAEAGY